MKNLYLNLKCSEEITSLKNQTGITNFGLTIGVNLGDNRPTLCLFYGKGKVDDEKVLCNTIL